MKNELSGFYKLSPDERLKKIKELSELTDEEVELLKKTGALGMETANRMIENVIGIQEVPIGIATNFFINRKEYLVPMALEEPSVVAAASNAARLCLPEGFKATSTEPLMTGQIQLVNVPDTKKACEEIMKNSQLLIEMANQKDPGLVAHNGGARGIEVREVSTIRGKMLIIHLTVDVRDAMGANAINTMCEAISPKLEELSGAKVRLRIITNLSLKRMAKASAIWKKEVIGEEAIEGVLDAYAFALSDHFRCTTHNKGIMNGIDAIALATSQDFRALEAAAHSYASLNGYHPLTKYFKDEKGNLVGELEMPIAVGVIGGASRTNPIAKVSLKILNVSSSQEFAQILVSVGLAQNFAALKALSTVGIQTGHMKLHSKNIAIMAGACGSEIETLSEMMVSEKNINVNRAKEILEEIRK